jgi:hypothetical protein
MEIYPRSKEEHTKRLRRPAADVFRQQVHRRRNDDTDLESLYSETSFVNVFQSKVR